MSRSIIAVAIVIAFAVPAHSKDWTHAWARVDTNMHSGPSRSHRVIERMIEGFDLALYKCQKGWCEVGYNGKRGYARQKDIRTERLNYTADCTDMVDVMMGGCD